MGKKTNSGKSAANSTPALTNRVTQSLNSLKSLASIIFKYSGVIAPGGEFGRSIQGNKQDFSVKRQLVPTYPNASGKTTPDGVEFNLPPHLWSLPIDPINRDKVTSVYLNDATSDDISNNIGTKLTADHSQRRGKMWLFSELLDNKSLSQQSTATPNTQNEGGKSDTGRRAVDRALELERLATTDGTYKQIAKSYKPSGFQFLWNPESIQTSVSTNPEIVPDAGDRFRSVVGVFPSTEHVTFTLILDRTNDFACVYRDFYQNNNNIATVANKYERYYKTGLNQKLDGSTSFPNKLQQLMEYGTMHDVEYIFKMLNAGTIFQNIQPTNPLGRKTFDLGYLYPALTAVEFGPSTTVLKPLSYVGWLQSVSFRHIAFNTNMVPLRTELAFDLWVYTGFGQVNSR